MRHGLVPQIELGLGKYISLLHWSGISAGEPEHPELEANFFFAFTGVYLGLNGFVLSYSVMNYMDYPLWNMPGVSYSIPINSHTNGTVGVDYNVEKEEVYFRISVAYSF